MKEVCVVGCGIVGLTSAIKLQEKGFQVKIVAKERHEKTLSNKVGAIWFPFEIYPKENANRWASLAYKEYSSHAETDNGVTFIPFMTAYNEDSNIDWTLEMPAGKVRKATSQELPKGLKMAFISTVPLAEPMSYLPYLFERFLNNGGSFIEMELQSFDQFKSMGALVVNCTGLGAKALCHDDELQPMRGQILRCEKLNVPSFAESTTRGALCYIINRRFDCVVGGTDYIDDWNAEVDQEDTVRIKSRLMEIGVTDQEPQILEEIVGLRPKRSAVRFEFDKDYDCLFHNYGHGGAGFTVAWGCAIELAEIFYNKFLING